MNSETRAVIEILGDAMVEGGDQVAVQEAFSRVVAMLSREDQGWLPLFGGGNNAHEYQFGLTLADLKEWWRRIDEEIIGAPWIGRGFRLRANYIWEGGIRYGNVPGSGDTAIRGKKNIQNIIDRPGNQKHFFGAEARRKRERCLYTAGVAFWIGDEATGNIEAVPLWQITDQLLEPNGLGYAWAYRRQWSEHDLKTGEFKPQVRWYFTDEAVEYRVKKITPMSAITGQASSGDPEPVDQTHVIFDMHANKSEGLVYGAPDAIAAHVWNAIARDATMDGVTITKAMASFAFKAKAASQQGGQNSAIQMASPHGAGATYVSGQAGDLSFMSQASKAYDFKELRWLVAIVASALDVSVIHLTANPGDAGSSYGSASTLDLPSRLSMEARREEHIEMDKRVLRWLGVQDPDVTFKPYDLGDTIYRAIQALVMEYQNDTMTRQELRDRFDDLMGRPNGTVPTDSQRPSVLSAKAMAAVGAQVSTTDPNKVGDGVTKATTGSQPGATQPQTANPAQGKSNGTGGQGGGNASNDIRRGGGGK